MQGEKREFIDNQTTDKGYLESRVTWPKSKFEVKAGSVIPISIITGINSDLPGEIIGQVRENVYDTVTGNYLLIPQGTKVMATYDSVIAYGQERALLCWSQMRRPDGSSLDLECSPGIDLAGYAGMSDQVDNHWGRIIGGVILSTALSVGTTASQGDIEGYNATIEQQMAADAADTINDVGQQITKKNLNIQPTIKIRPGFSANILVNKDMILTPYKL
jgi:type IV secretory pathway VirB10-like protein